MEFSWAFGPPQEVKILLVTPAKAGVHVWEELDSRFVQNCLFGVDIQQQAIEICRLRLWLSLVVDYDLGIDPFTAEKSQFSAAIGRISQLPNLEMNFHSLDWVSV